MSLPAFCDPPVAACCETWFSIADEILHYAVDGLCTEDCPEVASWVSHGRPQATGSFVSVWLDNWRTVGIAPARFIPKRLYTYGIVFQEDGFPLPRSSGEGLTLPSGPEYHYAALHSYAHAESVETSVYEGLVATGSCVLHSVSEMRAEIPDGGHVRWVMTVLVEKGVG